MKHIVIATVGSLGDLFPFLAVGQVLRRRGHRVTVATHAVHRDMVLQAGLAFHDASGMPEPDDREAFTARAFHPWHGPAFVVRDFAAADVRASYQRLLPLCTTADLLVTSTLAFAGQILGETFEAAGRLQWRSALLAPASFLSVHDMPATGLAAVDVPVRASPLAARTLQHLCLGHRLGARLDHLEHAVARREPHVRAAARGEQAQRRDPCDRPVECHGTTLCRATTCDSTCGRIGGAIRPVEGEALRSGAPPTLAAWSTTSSRG